MHDSMQSSSSPVAVSQVMPYISLAKQLEKHSAMAAFYCRLFAADKLNLIRQEYPNDPDVKRILLEQVECAEKLKEEGRQANGGTEFSRQEFEEFCMGVFERAEREGDGSGSLRRWVTGAQLIDVMEQFGDLSDKLKQRRKYCRWKATQASKPSDDSPSPHRSDPVDQTLQNHTQLSQATVPPPPLPHHPFTSHSSFKHSPLSQTKANCNKAGLCSSNEAADKNNHEQEEEEEDKRGGGPRILRECDRECDKDRHKEMVLPQQLVHAGRDGVGVLQREMMKDVFSMDDDYGYDDGGMSLGKAARSGGSDIAVKFEQLTVSEGAVTEALRVTQQAVSALSFEDIPTGKEKLREALRILGDDTPTTLHMTHHIT
eukprot:GHVQ01029371.1.p1 GENE.GHVQ01029371.1~~GHVQ01029371.1.p1  ORF type:complete len:372 (+),score=92.84 GHVQ01029371.1:425-1540(+)